MSSLLFAAGTVSLKLFHNTSSPKQNIANLAISPGGRLLKSHKISCSTNSPPVGFDSTTDRSSTVLVKKDLMPFTNTNGNLKSLGKLHAGIGIIKFFSGKKLLITGATGFLAKVLVEKILRTMPEVGKIFLIIKAKNKEAAAERLMNEVINTEIFKCIKQEHGESYEAFMLSKLVPVVGNICDTNIGIEEDLAHLIAEEVDIIINSAANTVFHERFDVSLDINTRGPEQVTSFAKKCKNLKLLVQVSTAYANGKKEGKLMEKALDKEGCIASNNKLDVEAEIKMALQIMESFAEKDISQKMKEFGLERAKKYGWQDTYVFTKAMGEMITENTRGEIPLVIIRPSIIESTLIEPFSGWIEGNRMMDPIFTMYGKGLLSCFLTNPQEIIDLVPADMVVNATLAAIAKHGGGGIEVKDNYNNIYQIASSVANPLSFQDLANIAYQHFSAYPCYDPKGNPIHVSESQMFTSMQDFSSHIENTNPVTQRYGLLADEKISRKLEIMRAKTIEHVKYLANLYQPYTFYAGRFDNSNVEELINYLSEEERREFGFDVRSIDWKDYLTNVHFPGLRKYVMKDTTVLKAAL